MSGINYKPLDEVDAAIIMGLAENNMRATETAYDLHVHRNTVVYRVQKIKELTGLDPLNFYDLHQLVHMVEAEMKKPKITFCLS